MQSRESCISPLLQVILFFLEVIMLENKHLSSTPATLCKVLDLELIFKKLCSCPTSIYQGKAKIYAHLVKNVSRSDRYANCLA